MKLFRILTLTFLSFFIVGLVVLFLLPTQSLLQDKNFSTAVYDDQQQLLRLTLNKEDKYRLYTPLSKMPPDLIAATLLQEDQYFHWHFGVNPYAMLKAAYQTYGLHSRRMGASTITMQLARLRFGIASKKFSGKIWQIIRALQLEMHYSKNQLLEAYLNLAPYGGNIEGVGAASIIYFNKSIDKTTLPEILTLSIIPQNPTNRTAHNEQLKDIRNKLFLRWIKQHPEAKVQKASFQLPLALQNNRSLPFIAPHMVNEILSHFSEKPKTVHTTLDSSLQKLVERVTQQYVARHHSQGVYNAAVLLVDTRTLDVKALMGSSNFFDKNRGGQINGAEIKRSPGSTLKPFIYGLALDQGLIHPNTVLKDVPRSFGSYNPENFDYDFMGPVKAKDALILSRNIPAIVLANQLAHPNLFQFLEKAGVSQLKSESYYGLALALGGAELTMKELTSLYAMLQNEGVWRPLRTQKTAHQSPSVRLLSPEASFLLLDMLKDTPKPEAYSGATDKVSWKTGTSSGFRDAWTVGIFGPYVLTVWIGNFDNTSNPAFVGKTIAAPLFFELIDAIHHEKGVLLTLEKHPESMNLAQIDVCKASGMLPTRHCPETEKTWFIPGKSPIHSDTIFREVAINSKTGLRTCHFDQSTLFKVYEFWQTDLLKIFKQAGIQRPTPPFFEPDCKLTDNTGTKPQITSPQKELTYMIRANSGHPHQIPFTAVSDAGIKHLYWFINETFLAKTSTDTPFLWISKPGHFVVRVIDDQGLSDARDIFVQLDS